MSRILLSSQFVRKLAEYSDNIFLRSAQYRIAERLESTIHKRIETLSTYPEIGRPYESNQKYRELVVEFGKGTYIVLYQYSKRSDTVKILNIKSSYQRRYH